ncbi:ubiquinone biosynthesis accessory factor UbiJ [Craterilacuibacter sp.]|uniref:ubiquinone biosynthesis accessory factor UbiJ n=1 Tax=Craterilacuibacter sp. TaxID=2870909 RepID=UPI003F2C2C2A
MQISLLAFNHLLGQHPQVRAELAAHAGRRVAITLAPVTVSGVVTEAGYLAACQGEPEATVRLSHGVVLSSLSGQPSAMGGVAFDGDGVLASSLAALLSRLHWDAEEDLSRIVGDSAAHRVGRLVRSALGVKGEIGGRLLESWVEHLRDEVPLLARKRDVEQFVAAVDTLRDDSARLQKRLAQLEARLPPPTPTIKSS